MKRNIIIDIICFLLIFLFVYAGTSKLYDRIVFASQLQQFPFIRTAAAPISLAVPFAELFIVGLLFFPASRQAGLYASLTLLCLFTIYLIVMQLMEKHLPCSCGGIISMLSWRQHIIFNLFFIMLNVAGINIQRKNKQHTSAVNFLSR